jgi:hypothetical protein
MFRLQRAIISRIYLVYCMWYSPDDGSLKPKHVVRVYVQYIHMRLSCEWGNNNILLCFICDTYATGCTHPQLTLWSWELLERPLDSFPAFYGTRWFSTEFTRALHLFLSWARPIQSTSLHPPSPRSILTSTHLCLGIPSGLFPSGFLTNHLHAFLFSPFVLYGPPISSSSIWLF